MIKFLPTNDAPKDVILPQRSTTNDAGYDIRAPHDFCVAPGERSQIIWTNIKVILPPRFFCWITNRSSVMKKGLIVDCSGIIDAGYANNPNNDGNIGVVFRNITDEAIFVNKEDKMCQGIIMRYYTTDDDTVEKERVGGWGSTGA